MCVAHANPEFQLRGNIGHWLPPIVDLLFLLLLSSEFSHSDGQDAKLGVGRCTGKKTGHMSKSGMVQIKKVLWVGSSSAVEPMPRRNKWVVYFTWHTWHGFFSQIAGQKGVSELLTWHKHYFLHRRCNILLLLKTMCSNYADKTM